MQHVPIPLHNHHNRTTTITATIRDAGIRFTEVIGRPLFLAEGLAIRT